MRGNDKVHTHLSEVLKAELTAVNQYFLHGKMCDNWGYFRLGVDYRKESIEEMVHAEKLIDRILFLDGTPNMTDIGKINVGTNVKAQFESDLALEMQAVRHLNEAIKVSTEVSDNASRGLFGEILVDEEEHVDHLEGQLHAIDEMGLENYLAQQLHKSEERQGQGTSPKDTAALTFARELVEKRGQVPASSIRALRDYGFTDGEIAEIVAHAALNIFTNYFNIALDVDVDFPRVALHQVA